MARLPCLQLFCNYVSVAYMTSLDAQTITVVNYALIAYMTGL